MKRQSLFITVIFVGAAAASVLWLMSGQLDGLVARTTGDERPSAERSDRSTEDPAEPVGSGRVSRESRGDSPRRPFRMGNIADEIDNDTIRLDFPELVSAADAGDGLAAFRVARGLMSCSGVPEGEPSETELTPSEFFRSQRTHMSGQDIVVEWEALLRNDITRCSGVSVSERNNWQQWLRRSAELGNSYGQIQFALSAPDFGHGEGGALVNPEKVTRFKDEAAEFLNQAVLAGNIDALHAAGIFYSGPLFEKEGFARVVAHAHFEAFEIATDSRDSNSVAGPLTAAEQDEVDRITKLLLRRCCE